MLNITKGSVKGAELEGSIYSSKEQTGGPPLLLGEVHFMMGEVLISSSYEAAAERAIKYGDKFQQLCAGLFWNTVEMFHRYVHISWRFYITCKQKLNVCVFSGE